MYKRLQTLPTKLPAFQTFKDPVQLQAQLIQPEITENSSTPLRTPHFVNHNLSFHHPAIIGGRYPPSQQCKKYRITVPLFLEPPVPLPGGQLPNFPAHSTPWSAASFEIRCCIVACLV
jgi:hypothetical protein